jgi:galactonate dehydratase
LKVERGYLLVPDKPGIGVELNEEALGKYPYVPRSFTTRLGADGAVIDQ